MSTLTIKEVQLIWSDPEIEESMVFRTSFTPDDSTTDIQTAAQLITMIDFSTDMQADANGRIAVMCSAITKQIEAYCQRLFISRSVTERISGDGSSELVLSWAPITAVASLKYAPDAKDVAAETAKVEGTDFDLDGDTGRLWLYAGAFYEGRANIEIQYTSGDATDKDFQLAKAAFIHQAVATWREWDKQFAGLSSRELSDRTESKAFTDTITLLKSTREMLQSLRRFS